MRPDSGQQSITLLERKISEDPVAGSSSCPSILVPFNSDATSMLYHWE